MIKDKEIPPSRPQSEAPRSSRRQRSRTLQIILITYLAMYLWYSRAPARLHSWFHPILTSDEKWLVEIADLMKELYTLLGRMKYIKANAIAYPPHSSPAINTTLATLLGFSPSAIIIQQILPYVKQSPGPMYNSWNESIMSATNWRAWRYNNDIDGSRDAWEDDTYSIEEMLAGVEEDPEVPLLKPWQVALTGIDEIGLRRANDSCLPRGGKMILDLKTRNLWTVGSGAVESEYYHDSSIEDCGSIDPVTRGQTATGAKAPLSRIKRAHIEMYASRPANEVLRDYIERYKSLEWVPGFAEGDKIIAYPRDTYRALYKKHGWPSNFHPTAFEKERRTREQENQELWRLSEPIRKLEEQEDSHKQYLEAIQSWRDDLVALDALISNPMKESALYDKVYKTYRGRTREQALIAIEDGISRAEGQERKLEELRIVEKGVGADVRAWRDEYQEKYGSDWNLEDRGETVRYEE